MGFLTFRKCELENILILRVVVAPLEALAEPRHAVQPLVL